MTTITLTRQRLVAAQFNARLTDDAYRLRSLRSQAMDDNERDPFEKWHILDDVEIVHTGEVVPGAPGAEHNPMQRVVALVTEHRFARFE